MKLITYTASLLLAWTSPYCFAREADAVANEKITFLQQVDPTSQQNLKDAGMEHRSQVFYRQVSGAELNAGVDMMIDADGAVIQLSPLDQVKNGQRIEKTRVPVEMTLASEKAVRRVNDDVIALHRRTEGLRETFPELYGRAHVMKIPADMGRGKFRLQANGSAGKEDSYLLYVLDKGSDVSLTIKTPRSRFANKSRLTLDAFVESSRATKIANATATLIAPGGKRFGVTGKIVQGRFKTDWPINVDVSRIPGELWQLEVRTQIHSDKGEIFERIARVATDIYEPTAAIVAVDSTAKNLALTLDVQQPGRYEIRALVYGSDSAGVARPLFLNYQAEWLEAGQQTLALAVDKSVIEKTRIDQAARSHDRGLNDTPAVDFTALYEVRDIQLLDQSRMAVLQTKAGQWRLP